MPKTDGIPFDRRFLPRVAAPFGVKPRGLPVLRGLAISFDAITCLDREDIELGRVFDLDLLLPHEASPFAVRGRVVERVLFGGQAALRVRFESMSPQGRQQIAGWMARYRRAA